MHYGSIKLHGEDYTSSQTGLVRQRWVSNTAGSNKEPVSQMNQQNGGSFEPNESP